MRLETIRHEVDQLYRAHFGKLVASMLNSITHLDTETAEDIVHDTFSSAIDHWNKNGIPTNTTGWVYKVCRNKALNKLKKAKVALEHSKKPAPVSEEIVFFESAVDDMQLKLLFACAHPDLSPKVQVVITLKYVVNLRIDAIAKTLALSVAALDKLLVRARHQIKEENILLGEPHASVLLARLPIVHKIIYLIFNEGYRSASGKEIFREELCEEALLLCKGILDVKLGNRDTEALYALMLFNSARFKSRFTKSGEILDLENQDRSLWNVGLITLGREYLMKARVKEVSEYHLEASIAYFHCTASSFDLTDWKAIANLYARLQRMKPNPFVELNYAIALYNSGKKDEAFPKLHTLEQRTFFSQYYLLNCCLGKLYRLEGNHLLARNYYLKAIQQTAFEKERKFIQRQIDEMTY